MRDLLDPTPITVTGRPLVDYLADAPVWDGRSSPPASDPLLPDAGIAVLRGNLAPSGAIVKPAAASAHLLHHRGPAVVFDSVEDLHARIDYPELDVTADSVLVLRGCGPMGYPGMPEVANLPLPQRLLQQGVRDVGPDLRRPDERHGIRHRGAPRRAGSRRGRAAGPRPGR